jgi:hypothetical protein
MSNAKGVYEPENERIRAKTLESSRFKPSGKIMMIIRH